jgi:TRAP-type C4-dicarboxylate transport system permease small subunit
MCPPFLYASGQVMEKIDRWLARLEKILVFVATLCTLAMMCLTTADAAGRYVFNAPIQGAYEISEKYLMPALVFLGLGYAYRGGIFIRVTFLADRLPRRLKLCADYIAQIVSMLCCLLLAYASLGQAISVVNNGTTLSTVPVPVAPAYFFIPVGFALLIALMLVDLTRVSQGKSRLFKDGSPDS